MMTLEIDFALQNADWPCLVLDAAGTVRAANLAAIATFGSQLGKEGAKFALIWSPQNGTPLEKCLAQVDSAKSVTTTLKLQTTNGTVQSLKCSACIFIRGDEKLFLFQFPHSAQPEAGKMPANAPEAALEPAVAHKQKLDCALQLIRTVALDFNNALTSVLGHTSLLLAQLPSGNPWRNSLIEVEKSAEKAAEIASDLASFSRQEKDARGNTPGNLNQVLRRTVELYQAPGAPSIAWTLQLESRLFTANFDEAKLQQAFMKILDNAVQSPGRDRRIQVASSNRSLSEPLSVGSGQLAPGHYVCVEISDNGAGIAPDILSRVFEPFFTTKAGHRGLGLAWVYGIVTNHGGQVTVSNHEAGGAIVTVYLPARKKIVRDHEAHDNDLTGRETILLVDDEELLLTMGQMILSAYGYRVLTASSGEKAFEIFRNSNGNIDLVVTDLVMPQMSGRELSERLRQTAPGVRILCTSGYVRSSQADDEDAYLQKPFTSQALLRKVKEALN